MKIVVVGAGEVGAYLCQTLSDRGHDVTVIEAAEGRAESIDETQDVKVHHGNGASAEVLSEARVGEARFFLAMTSDDRTNLLSCSLANCLGAQTTIARIHDQTYTDNSYINYQEHFGIDFLLNPEALSAVELAKAIRNPGRVAVENFARGEIEVQQVSVSKKSKLLEKPLKEVRLPAGVRIGYIQRNGALEVPNGESLLLAGDQITLVGPPAVLFELRPKFEPESEVESQRVVIFGGTETAIALTRLLTNPRFKIRILDSDPDTCRSLAERFPHVTVIHGSATSLRLMEEEQIGHADYFVACTRDDEDNIMTSLQAAKLGCKHVQLVISKPDYEDVLENIQNTLGVELVVSPRVATVNEVLRFLNVDSYVELADLPGHTAKILEIPVSTKSQANGQAIRAIAWPPGCVIVALLRKFRAKVPGPDDEILAGDRVVAIVQQEQVKPLLKLLA